MLLSIVHYNNNRIWAKQRWLQHPSACDVANQLSLRLDSDVHDVAGRDRTVRAGGGSRGALMIRYIPPNGRLYHCTSWARGVGAASREAKQALLCQG